MMIPKTIQHQAEIQDRERERIVKEAMRRAQGFQRRMRVAALKAYKRGADPLTALRIEAKGLQPIIQDAMLAAHLQGINRSIITAKRAETLALDRNLDETVAFLRKRLAMPFAELAEIERKYGLQAATATGEIATVLEEKVGKALIKTIQTNTSKAGGIENIRQAFNAAGVTPDNDYQLEQIFRTQTGQAYIAGRVTANEDEVIDEVLWGYEYVTVGDDVVRPNHVAMNGIRMKKDDPRWSKYMPLCGYNCRCEVVEIHYGSQYAVEYFPSGPVNVDGVMVMPEPDPGWGFNPAAVFQAA
jgi:SPP1 gp7 family putative phage head morphogenesis protein